MAKLTATRHGDAANSLFGFYRDKVHELEESGQYFMAAVALGLALETAVLTYLLVEFCRECWSPRSPALRLRLPTSRMQHVHDYASIGRVIQDAPMVGHFFVDSVSQ
jgi:hypothetical protein